MHWILRLDMRSPAFAGNNPFLYRIGVDMAAAVDALGFHQCVLSERHSYGRFDNAESLRATGLYQVLTPRQGVELARRLGAHGHLFVHPLLAGLDPAIGWETIRLLKEQVLPQLSND